MENIVEENQIEEIEVEGEGENDLSNLREDLIKQSTDDEYKEMIKNCSEHELLVQAAISGCHFGRETEIEEYISDVLDDTQDCSYIGFDDEKKLHSMEIKNELNRATLAQVLLIPEFYSILPSGSGEFTNEEDEDEILVTTVFFDLFKWAKK